ncbi:MAG: hypothetical protein NXI03_10820 [Alphaproteobacteria bacterium]|uniref:hypothetical protein n=1 Tax=Maricaulis alexandrii TaxID=2570354 RepID=UPI0011084771|nr:hypothetical protein [Maricaulis alexandrii]MCR9268051.1 hypothetical protein [Alphaproteobacteria bacterium]
MTTKLEPLDIVSLAMECESLDDLTPVLEQAATSQDPWVINAGILAIGHAARRFKSFPLGMKQALWSRVHDFPDHASNLRGTCLTAQDDIDHFKAKGI